MGERVSVDCTTLADQAKAELRSFRVCSRRRFFSDEIFEPLFGEEREVLAVGARVAEPPPGLRGLVVGLELAHTHHLRARADLVERKLLEPRHRHGEAADTSSVLVAAQAVGRNVSFAHLRHPAVHRVLYLLLCRFVPLPCSSRPQAGRSDVNAGQGSAFILKNDPATSSPYTAAHEPHKVSSAKRRTHLHDPSRKDKLPSRRAGGTGEG